jgi:presenilin-like A22 family membrane protease
MYIIHEQKQKSNLIVISIYIITFIVLSLIIINPSFLRLQKLPDISRIILLLVLVVDLIFLKIFYELKFRVTSDGLEFGYGFFKNKVKKDNIASVLVDNSQGIFFGYGVRFSRDKTIGYIAKSGSGLRIIYKDQRQFFITMNNPEEALKIIKQHNYV